MRDDLGDQLALLGNLVALGTPQRLAAHVDLTLLAHHDGEPFRKVPFLGPLQHQPGAVECALNAAFLELARRRHVRLVETFEERAGRLAPPLPVRLLLAPPRLERGERLVELRHPPLRQPTDPSRLIEISFCASTANSIGSCCSTSRTKPLTTSATASSSESPRCMQ